MTAVPAASALSLTRIAGFVALTKPRIIELLLVTTLPTMVVAARGIPSVWLMAATMIGGTLAAGGANAINMYVDRDIDALMDRTKNRPLVTGLIQPTEALVFAVSLEIFAFAFLWQFVNLLSASLAVGATLFYVFIYTLWLKRSTSTNVVIGGAAGAAPVLIGWSAVTNTLAWPPVILFAVIFFWTPPHTWALAMKYKDDYSAADVPMLPSVATFRNTTTQIVIYTVVLWVVTLLFGPVAEMGWLYNIAAVALGAGFLGLAVQLRRSNSEAKAMRLFSYSITYITLLFGAMAVDQLLVHGL